MKRMKVTKQAPCQTLAECVCSDGRCKRVVGGKTHKTRECKRQGQSCFHVPATVFEIYIEARVSTRGEQVG